MWPSPAQAPKWRGSRVSTCRISAIELTGSSIMKKAVARLFQPSAHSGLSVTTRSRSSIARAWSFALMASPARLISRSAVSLPERDQRRSIRLAMPFASLSSLAAARRGKRASSVAGRRAFSDSVARAGFRSGFGSAATEGTSVALSATARTSEARRRIAGTLGPPAGPSIHARLKLFRGFAPGSALARLVALLGLVDDVDPPLAAHDLVVAVAPAQRLQRVADLHGALSVQVRSPRTGPVLNEKADGARGSRRPDRRTIRVARHVGEKPKVCNAPAVFQLGSPPSAGLGPLEAVASVTTDTDARPPMPSPSLALQDDAAARRRSTRRGWSVVASAFGVMFAAFGCT